MPGGTVLNSPGPDAQTRAYRKSTFSPDPFQETKGNVFGTKSPITSYTEIPLVSLPLGFSLESPGVQFTPSLAHPSPPHPGSPGQQKEFQKHHKRRRAVLSPAGSAGGTPGHSEDTQREGCSGTQPCR